jgi:hypothetical protein
MHKVFDDVKKTFKDSGPLINRILMGLGLAIFKNHFSRGLIMNDCAQYSLKVSLVGRA